MRRASHESRGHLHAADPCAVTFKDLPAARAPCWNVVPLYPDAFVCVDEDVSDRGQERSVPGVITTPTHFEVFGRQAASVHIKLDLGLDHVSGDGNFGHRRGKDQDETSVRIEEFDAEACDIGDREGGAGSGRPRVRAELVAGLVTRHDPDGVLSPFVDPVKGDEERRTLRRLSGWRCAGIAN